MTHQEKVGHFIEKMKSLGVGTSRTSPLFFRLLWKLGFQIPPPLFINYKTRGLIIGIFSGIGFELLHLVPLFGTPRQFSIYTFIIEGLIFGSLLGYSMAMWHKHQNEKYDLPDWKDYPRESNV